jgi:Lon protease-like protein
VASLDAVGDAIDRFPLFPLGLVLLPEEVVPLHIFEDRYKLMIGECLDQDAPFGILWMADDGLREIGCTALVTQVLEELDDGRLNVLVTGADPFRLTRRIDDLPYPAGDVELLDEVPEDDFDPLAGTGAREHYADLVERVTDSRPAERDLEDLNAYEMAATLDFALDAKQSLLELRTESDRLERLDELFRATLERVDKAESTAEVARTNGHLKSSPGLG